MLTEIITKAIVRKFSRRARGYTCVYYALAFGNGKNNAQQCKKILPELIEKMVKSFKIHQSALDFEGKYIIKFEKRTVAEMFTHQKIGTPQERRTGT